MPVRRLFTSLPTSTMPHSSVSSTMVVVPGLAIVGDDALVLVDILPGPSLVAFLSFLAIVPAYNFVGWLADIIRQWALALGVFRILSARVQFAALVSRAAAELSNSLPLLGVPRFGDIIRPFCRQVSTNLAEIQGDSRSSDDKTPAHFVRYCARCWSVRNAGVISRKGAKAQSDRWLIAEG